MKCPICNHENPSSVAYCEECGAQLAPAEPVIAPASKDRQTCPSCGASSPAQASHCARCGIILPLRPGQALAGRFRVEQLVADGGMGRVYRAQDQQWDTVCAVKELRDDQHWTGREAALYRDFLRQEADLLDTIKNLRTVPWLIEPYTESDGRCFFVMEFVSGMDLEAALNKLGQPFPPDLVVDWGVQVCDLLTVLHNHQPDPIVHQDLKPANVIVREGTFSKTDIARRRFGGVAADIVLLDFGLARHVRRGSKLEHHGGTEGYAAPEQIEGGRPEPRSDLYGLAATMHHLLTWRDPRDETGPVPSARALNPQVPTWLDEILAINLRADPRQRYESAAALRADLVRGQVSQTAACPACGAANPRQFVYCQSCAAPLSRRSRVCPHCHEFAPDNARFCPDCGQPLA